jgi:uncharacterized protein DUF5916
MRARTLVMQSVCLSAALFGTAASGRAQGVGSATSSAARRVVSARRSDSALVRSSIVVDGHLNDATWQSVEPAADFVQQRPTPGAQPAQRTEARIWLDGAALYVGMRLLDSAADSIVAPIARRDADVYSDWAFVLIDSYNDRRTAFQFAVNPRGVQRDAQITNDEEWMQDFGWNAVWQAETSRDSLGWTAEFRIPLSQLRFSNAENAVSSWGIQFGRHLARRNERSYWSPVLQDRPGFVSQFGILGDVSIPKTASSRFEVVPYTLAKMTQRTVDPQDPLARAREPRATLGADLKWGLTPDFTLTATLNPDFGQVESDPSEVNLTGSESFFREQRPFFLEGAELFNFNMSTSGWIFGQEQLFYSRRIGRAPQMDDPDGARYVNRPLATDLLGALKVTGKTQSGLSLGVLSAVTDEMRASVDFGDGIRQRAVVEPLTQYSMARVQKDFGQGQSHLAAVATSVLRGADAPKLRRSATIGGIDFHHRFGQRRYQLAGYVLGSTVRGTPEAITATQRNSVHYFQRPDATHLEVDSSLRSLNGIATELRLNKIAGNVRWGGGAHLVTSGFEANDLGFHSRSDFAATSGWIGRTFFSGPRGIRNWEIWLNGWAGLTLGGERDRVGQSIWARAEFTNFWEIEGTIQHDLPFLSIQALRGGPALYNSRRLFGLVRLASDARRATVAQLMLRAAHEVGDSGSLLNIMPQITQRITDRAQLVLAPSAMWWRNPQQFVEWNGDRYVVGDIRQTTAMLVTRLDWSFTPRLTFQLYAQPFLSAGTYHRLGSVGDAHAASPEARIRRFAPNELSQTTSGDWRVTSGGSSFEFGDPNFAFNELRTNSVLRWEYRPGSALFLVWSHGRSVDGASTGFDLRRQARELGEARGDHVFLLKVSHWLGR